MAEKQQNEHISMSAALDDEQRVKVLSPGMLVAKRFFRNRLAMIGLIIIVSMFIFAFIGGMISPYGEGQVFRTYELTLKDYAGVTYNETFQYTVAEGKQFPALAQSEMILAINNGEASFTSKDTEYTLLNEGENFYRVVELEEVAKAVNFRGKLSVNASEGFDAGTAFKEALETAFRSDQQSFEFEGTTYSIAQSGKQVVISKAEDVAIASYMVFNPHKDGDSLSYEFRCLAEKAMNEGSNSFTADGKAYTMELDSENMSAVFLDENGTEYASASHFTVKGIANGVFISSGFRQAIQEAVETDAKEFLYTNENGGEEEYTLVRKNKQYTVRRQEETQVNNIYESPSKEHLLGTDGNGMDILTRLMYGGRISLLIGFVAIFLEILFGIILGGVAGYFGKWVDNLIMRIVDIFNCIPSMPLYIILGSLMDFLKLDPRIRIYFLCVLLAILSWPRIARMVRGQILSLREQEFMVAAEATGISTGRKIFRHLIPNVIPQLIVMATMGLGEIIIMEATLSFLGLGVKFPFASWGNIVNAVNDIYVMTNFWFVWIPAGFCILITVLGFNFIGDGLRDAFDPKMKR